MSEIETTSASNWKVKRDGKARRQGTRWEEVTFTLDFRLLDYLCCYIFFR